MTTETLEAVRGLRATTCRCGESKRRGMSFCRRCYYLLPRPLRGRLYSPIGNGYEAALSAAHAHLGDVGEATADVAST